MAEALPIRYTYHGRLQREARGFAEEQVRACIEDPDTVEPGAATAQQHIKAVDSRLMRVVFTVRAGYTLVITVMEERPQGGEGAGTDR